MKTLMEATVQNSGGRLGSLDAVGSDSQNVNTNFYPKATLHAGSGVGGILHDPDWCQMEMRDYLSRNNSFLNRSEDDSENDSKKTIPKAKNPSEYKYKQVKCFSITTRDYIANNTISEVRHWGSHVSSLKERSKATEFRGLTPAEVNSRD